MTEAEWMACADPAAMVEFLGEDGTRSGCARVSERKLRLWVEACRRATGRLVPWGNEPATAAELAQAAYDWCLDSSWGEECPLALRAALMRDLVGNPFADRPWLIHRCPRCLQEGRWHWRGSDDAPGRWPYCPDCGVEMRHRRDLWLTPTVLSLARAAYAARWQACRRCVGHHDRRWRDSGTCLACRGTGRTGEGFLDPARLAVLSDALEEADCEEVVILEHLRGRERCSQCQGRGTNEDGGWDCGPCKGTGRVALRGPHAPGCWCVDAILGLE